MPEYRPIPEHLKAVEVISDIKTLSKFTQIILINIYSCDKHVVANRGGEVPILKQ